MSTQTDTTGAAELWAVEPSAVEGHARVRARIAGLHCSLCTGTIEKALGRMDGVGQVAVSLTHEQALVDYDPAVVAPQRILATLREIGYELYDPRKLRPFEDEERQLVREGVRLLGAITASLTAIGLIATVTGVASVLVPASMVVVMVPLSYVLLRKAGRATALLGATVIVAPGVAALMARALGLLPPWLINWLTAAVAVSVVAGIAHHILRMAYQSLRRGILNQHVLLEIGAFAGLAGGAIGLAGMFPGYPTAAFFAVSVLVANYHIFSEWLSLLVKTRSSQAVKKLLDLQPDLARVIRADGTEVESPVEQVHVGDRVRIRPGERIPVDGRVVAGHSTVDLSLVTGEPVPAEKTTGDTVVSGALNGAGTMLVETTAPASESFLAQVVRHVQDARALKPGVLHLVDRVLRTYTPTVLSICALALAGWLVGSWAATGRTDVQRAVFAALSVLVMGYPCAVGIAAPLAIVRGSGEAADLGIIMRTGEAFQTFRQVTQVLLDKTGTLTVGRPAVAEVHPAPGVDADELLTVAAAAEAPSEHPLARAITTAADQRLEPPPLDAEGFQATTGFGVTAWLDGHRILVGRPAFLTDTGIDLAAVRGAIAGLEAKGHTVVAAARDTRVLGLIALADTPRPEAAEAVAALRRAGVTPVLVTGDNPRAAAHIAGQLGIDTGGGPEGQGGGNGTVHAQVLPDGKAELVGRLQADGARVAMVGDGINDAPALMRADVGVALGSGTDIATESADIIIVRDDLRLVLTARDISRRAYRRVKQNVALAFIFNGIGIPLATTGLVYPVWAMVAMAASVTSLFLNSLGARPRLLFEAIGSVGRAPRGPGEETPT